jgi:hydrogenase nickel incorporation protein HypA/HybF
MHELSVATAVLNTAVKHARGRPVSLVAVQAGALRQVVPESLRFYWEIVARDTECEGAALELVEVEALLRCSACGHEWSPQLPVFRCGECGGADVEVASGEELCVDYIEVVEKEAACTAPR